MYFPWDKYFKKNNNELIFLQSLRIIIQNKIKSKSQEQNHSNE